MSNELPQWVIDGLTDIKMAARDPNTTDEQFFDLIASFTQRVTAEDVED